jgi:hypothetical protein
MAGLTFDEQKIIDAVEKDTGPSWFVGSVVNYAAAQEFLGETRGGRSYLRTSLRDAGKLKIGKAKSIGDILGRIALEVERLARLRVRVRFGNLKASIAAAPGETNARIKSKSQAKKPETVMGF